MKAFPQRLAKQLMIAKSAATVKEEKHKNKLSVNFRYKNNFCLKYFCFKYIIICRNCDKE